MSICLIHLVRPSNMNLDNEVPVIIGHVLEADIPQNTRIVQKYVYPAKFCDCCFNDSIAILDTVIVGYSMASRFSDFVNDYVGRLKKINELGRQLHRGANA